MSRLLLPAPLYVTVDTVREIRREEPAAGVWGLMTTMSTIHIYPFQIHSFMFHVLILSKCRLSAGPLTVSCCAPMLILRDCWAGGAVTVTRYLTEIKNS